MGRISRRLVILLTLITLQPLASQINDDLFIGAMLHVEPSTPIAGQKLLFTISFPLRYSANHQFTPPKRSFPSGIKVVSGPSFKVVSNPIDGEKVEFSYFLEINQAGSYYIESFELISGGRTSRSIPFELIVENPPVIEPNSPVSLAWREPPTSVYAGQAFTLILEAQNLTDLMLLESATLPPISSLIVENTPGFGSINEVKKDDEAFYSIPVGSWVFVAQNSGSVTIPPVRMRLDRSIKTSDPLTITIKPTPKKALTYGAVGNFKLTSEINQPNILEQGQTITVRVRLEGEGNFQLLQMPEPNYKNFELVDRQERELLEPSIGGYKGYREVVYRLKTVRGGHLNLVIPSFIWWNPERAMTERINPKIYSFKVANIEEQEETLQFLSTEDLMRSYDFNPKHYLWFLIPVIILLLAQLKPTKKETKASINFFSIVPIWLLLFFNQVPPTPAVLDQAQYNISSGQWQAAIDAYELSETILKNNIAAISYNKALAYYRLGNPGAVIYNLRKANYFDPFNSQYKKALKSYEHRQEITINAPLHQLSRFAMPILIFLMTTMALLAFIFKHHKAHRKTFILLTLFFTTAMVANYLYESYSSVEEIILTQDELLLRIPDPASSSSIIVKAGSSFIVKGKNNDYYLLYSSMGSEGWVINDHLLLLKGKYEVN